MSMFKRLLEAYGLRTPDAKESAARELAEAKINLLTYLREEERYRHSAHCERERIARLQAYLSEKDD